MACCFFYTVHGYKRFNHKNEVRYKFGIVGDKRIPDLNNFVENSGRNKKIKTFRRAASNMQIRYACFPQTYLLLKLASFEVYVYFIVRYRDSTYVYNNNKVLGNIHTHTYIKKLNKLKMGFREMELS